MSEDTDSSASANHRRRRRRRRHITSSDESSGTESDLSDDTPPENVQLTEGGWACYVEELEKIRGPSGKPRYQHARKHRIVASAGQETQDDSGHSTTDQEDETVAKPIISYFHRARNRPPAMSSTGELQFEAYIQIRSPLIKKVLREDLEQDEFFSDDDEVAIREPFQLLWHQFHALEMYSKDMSRPQDSRTHVNVLLDFLKTYDMPHVSELVRLCNPDQSIEAVSFPVLWYFFAPGTLVVTTERDASSSRAYLVREVTSLSKNIDSSYGSLDVLCLELERNKEGSTYLKPIRCVIAAYKGLRSLADLNLAPLDLLGDHGERRQSLLRRGRKYWNLGGQHMKDLIDRTQSAQSIRLATGRDRSVVLRIEKQENERVMIDAMTYSRQPSEDDTIDLERIPPPPPPMPASVRQAKFKHRYAKPSLDHEARGLGSMLPEGDEEPSEKVLILCPYIVRGFSFRSKEWHSYHVDNLVDVDFRKKSFDRLVLREDYKAVLKAMVAQHFTQGRNTFRDLVAGKGQGLNILLHGPPGVGKTLTAECIADLYERPLYSITSGDIGTNPDEVEKKLHKIFDYATTWNCVLLLDEADVFLAERDLENLSRNALVSVFLRNLEYFNGVFFLTTNRVGTIDEAFQSRLHITLGLDPLPVEDRRQIWYHFIKDLKQLSQTDRKILARHARDDWSLKEFNGRQIRNTVKIALTLARQDGVEVQARHIQVVLDIGTRFTSYMKRLKKMDQERLAEAIGTRLDTSANTLKIPEMPRVSQSSAANSRDALEGNRDEDANLDWD